MSPSQTPSTRAVTLAGVAVVHRHDAVQRRCDEPHDLRCRDERLLLRTAFGGHVEDRVSGEYLLQNLKGLLDSGMRQSLEALPDGIYSGLLHQGVKGVFFAFTAPDKQHTTTKERRKRQHYWRYIELSENTGRRRIEDNRYLITDLIRCQPDTARFVPGSDEANIFDLQEKVIESILLSSIEQVAVEEAPKLLDPIQQTIIATLHSYVNSPGFDRKEIIVAMQKLNVPLPRVYVKTLRKAFEAFKTDKQVHNLLSAVQSIENQVSIEKRPESEKRSQLKREDLKLICFDYVWD